MSSSTGRVGRTSAASPNAAASVSLAEHQSLIRENTRLVAQVRKLQELVSTMREEIADANAEVAALSRLQEEQMNVVMQELARERSLREKLQSHITERARIGHASVGTGTVAETGTSTQTDAATSTSATATSTSGGYGMDQGVGGSPMRSSRAIAARRDAPAALIPAFAKAAAVAAAPSHYHNRGGGGGGGTVAAGIAPDLIQFGDWLSRSAGYRPAAPGRELAVLFDAMGGTNVPEICAAVTERDLIEFGIPVIKARAIMHHVLEHTAYLLAS